MSVNPLTEAYHGPPAALPIALDMAKKGVYVAPVVIGIGAAIWGTDGAASVAYGLTIVVVNFLLSAWMLHAAGRVSLALMGAAALFGFLLRLGLITIAVLVVKDQPWVDLVPLGLTLIVTHLGILFWELRYVSGSLAYPGLKPSRRGSAPSTRPSLTTK